MSETEAVEQAGNADALAGMDTDMAANPLNFLPHFTRSKIPEIYFWPDFT